MADEKDFTNLLILYQVQCPLAPANPAAADTYIASSSHEEASLPDNRFTPRLLLGATNNDRDTIARVLASHLAAYITAKDPHESRTLILGLGLAVRGGGAARFTISDNTKILDLAKQCV